MATDGALMVGLADSVATVTLRRPDRLNALTWELIRDLRAALTRLGEQDEVRVVVITGEGRGFCSGLDLGQADAAGTADEVISVYRRQLEVASLATTLNGLPKPVIAAINGPAAGGGLSLALACDVRICVPSATFTASFVRIGLSACDVGLSWFLPRIVGLGAASEIMLTGRSVTAQEALRLRLVSRIVDPDDLENAASELAAEMARNSPFGLWMTKEVLTRNAGDASLAQAVELENRTQVLATRTSDMAEALAAFRARRPPEFKGSAVGETDNQRDGAAKGK